MEPSPAYSRSPTRSPTSSPHPSPKPASKRSSFFSLPGSSRSSFEVHQVIKKSTVQGFTDDELSGGETSTVDQLTDFSREERHSETSRSAHLIAPPPSHKNPSTGVFNERRRKPAPKISDQDVSSLYPFTKNTSGLLPESVTMQAPITNEQDKFSGLESESGLTSRIFHGLKLGVGMGRGQPASDNFESEGEEDHAPFQVERKSHVFAGPRAMKITQEKALPNVPSKSLGLHVFLFRLLGHQNEILSQPLPASPSALLSQPSPLGEETSSEQSVHVLHMMNPTEGSVASQRSWYRSEISEFGSTAPLHRRDTGRSNNVTVGSLDHTNPVPSLPASERILAVAQQSLSRNPERNPYILYGEDGIIDIENTLVSIINRFEVLERWTTGRLDEIERRGLAHEKGHCTDVLAVERTLRREIYLLQERIKEIERGKEHSSERAPHHRRIDLYLNNKDESDQEFEMLGRMVQNAESPPDSTLKNMSTFHGQSQEQLQQTSAFNMSSQNTVIQRDGIQQMALRERHRHSHSSPVNFSGKGAGVGRLVKLFETRDN